MPFVNLVHLKPLLMVLAAVGGTVGSGAMMAAFAGSQKDPGTFILSLNPSSMMIVENSTATSTITVTGVEGFSGTVGLSVTYLGASITATVSPTSVSVPLNGVAHSTLSVTAPSTVGSYTLIVLGVYTNHGKTTSSSAELTVQVVSSQDFTITASPSILAGPNGATNTTLITVTSVNGYTGNISLTFTAPFGYFTITSGTSPLRIVSGGAASSALTITTSTNTTPGTYSIIVTGTDGIRSHSTTVTLQVVDPTIPPFILEGLVLNSYTFNNSTMLTFNLQNTGNGTITLVSYVIRDSSGDAWSMTNWNTASIPVNSAGTATMYIGSSCPTCIYTGISGLFLNFQHGSTYTVTVTTNRNNQFTYTVTY
jgi:trimeric autotransporter adhesin